MNIVVFFHGACVDGFTAAWIASKHLPNRDVEFVESFYDQPLTDEQILTLLGKFVVFVDFSCSQETLLKICQVAADVLVLDHHKTARDTLTSIADPPKNLRICFDMQRCGAQITWDFFRNPCYAPVGATFVGNWEGPRLPTPPLVSSRFVSYVQDRDLWTWSLEGSRQVSAWISSWPQTFESWDTINTCIENDLGTVIRQGEAIERFIQRRVEAVLKSAYTAAIDGPNGTRYAVPCCNATSFVSEVGEALNAANPAAPFTMTWFQKGDKKIYSLRVGKGKQFDASAIAKHHGGGGHPAACGFTKDA